MSIWLLPILDLSIFFHKIYYYRYRRLKRGVSPNHFHIPQSNLSTNRSPPKCLVPKLNLVSYLDEEMGKASVIIYITIAVLLLLLISQSPSNKAKRHGHSHRRLKLRSNFTFDPHRIHHERIPFDPLVAKIERQREDKEWEKQYINTHHHELIHENAPGEESQPEWEDFMDAEDYINDEDRFNVTDRLVMLFPKIDVDPSDGFVSEHELTQWNLEQSRKEVLHRTHRDMEVHDKNHDGFVSFAEYEPPSWVRNSGRSITFFFFKNNLLCFMLLYLFKLACCDSSCSIVLLFV